MSRQVGSCRLCAFAAPAYLAARGTATSLDDLQGHDTVNLRHHSTGQPFRWPFRIGGRIREIVPAADIVVDVSDAVLATLVAGGGIGVTATFLAAPYVARGELVPVLPNLAAERDDVTAIWPDSRSANPAIRALLDWLQDTFRKGMAFEIHWEVESAHHSCLRPPFQRSLFRSVCAATRSLNLNPTFVTCR